MSAADRRSLAFLLLCAFAACRTDISWTSETGGGGTGGSGGEPSCANCDAGCCDDDACVPGDTDLACGQGATCQDCTLTGQVCNPVLGVCSDACSCGDFFCDPSCDEDAFSCPNDCGGGCLFCGDGFCDLSCSESTQSCPSDCGSCFLCGDLFCDSVCGEDEFTCPNDCGGGCFQCGDGFCDPTCDEDEFNCPDDCTSECVCGDGLCNPKPCGEDQLNCAMDCCLCGDVICNPNCGETEFSCAADCWPECPHGICEGGAPLAPSCDPCVAQVCAVDPYCCETNWDEICRAEVQSICGIQCNG